MDGKGETGYGCKEQYGYKDIINYSPSSDTFVLFWEF